MRDSNINGRILRLSLSRIPIADEKKARLSLTSPPAEDDLLSKNPQEALRSISGHVEREIKRIFTSLLAFSIWLGTVWFLDCHMNIWKLYEHRLVYEWLLGFSRKMTLKKRNFIMPCNHRVRGLSHMNGKEKRKRTREMKLNRHARCSSVIEVKRRRPRKAILDVVQKLFGDGVLQRDYRIDCVLHLQSNWTVLSRIYIKFFFDKKREQQSPFQKGYLLWWDQLPPIWVDWRLTDIRLRWKNYWKTLKALSATSPQIGHVYTELAQLRQTARCVQGQSTWSFSFVMQ